MTTAGLVDERPVADLGWRRLSPRMLAVHPVQETIRALPALIGVLFLGTSSGHGGFWGLIGVGLTVGLGILRWATTSYRVGGDQVQVRRGFLRRRVLSIPRDRVRTVDVTQHPMHRVMGLARLTIGTGQSDRKEGMHLDGLTVPEAARLREELLNRTPTTVTAAPTAAAPEKVIVAIDPAWVRYAPFTLSGLATVGIVAGFVWRIISEAQVDPERFGPLRATTNELRRVPLGVAVVEVALAVIAVVAVASALGYILAFWSFRLTRQPNGTLHVTRGLVTTRATTIEERRLRGVELSEPMLLRAVRGARCIAIATGLRVGRGAERGGSLLMPPGPATEAHRVGAAVLGHPEPLTAPLRAHGPRARRRRYVRAVGLGAVPAVALLLAWALGGWPAWPWQTALAVPVAGALLAGDRYRSLGHAVSSGYLVVRQGSLVRRRAHLECDGIIGWRLRRSFFQRRAGLVTVSATTAAGRQHYVLPDVPLADSVPLIEAATPDLLTPFLK
jgi:putative membrane protein